MLMTVIYLKIKEKNSNGKDEKNQNRQYKEYMQKTNKSLIKSDFMAPK